MLIQSKRLDTGIITDRRALLRGVGTLGLSAEKHLTIVTARSRTG